MIEMNYKKERLQAMCISLGLTLLCVLIGQFLQIPSPTIKTIGALLLIPVVTLLMHGFPFSTYLWTLCFLFFASALGAVLDFYRQFDAYDKIVHFFSGVLAAEIGLRIIQYLLDGYHKKNRLTICCLFSALFSFSCAALWEVYEFCGDTLLSMHMQGKNANTMGDISSGVLGGVLYASIYYLRTKNRTVATL